VSGKKKAVAIVSGGLDSTTLAYDLRHTGYDVDLLSFNYGQRHKKELQFAAAIAKRFGLRHDIINLQQLSSMFAESGSSLVSTCTCGPWHPGTDGPQRDCPEHGDDEHRIEVPEGHYAEDNMKSTVVPNRNMIMLSIATGIAISRGAACIAAGMHAGDHFIYPDCRPEFINIVNAAIMVGNEGFHSFEGLPIFTPYIHWTKADIAFRAMQLGVPLHMTWSCYKGGENHCGRCGTCVERLEAIYTAGKHFGAHGDFIPPDNTAYDDNEYWKVVIAKKKAEDDEAGLPFDDHSELY